jgi:hypothetical protein
MAYDPDSIDGHTGIGAVVQPIVSDVEGHFGTGFVLATNILLDVKDQLGNAVKRGTQYTLTVTETGGTVTTITVLHDPAVPYQETLPDNATVVFSLTGSTLYANFSLPFTILPNALVVKRVRLNFLELYARITKKRFL